MHLVQILQADGKSKIDGGDQILNFEVDEFDVVAEFLDDPSELPRCQICVVFIAGACANEFSGSEDKTRAPRLAYSHHNAVEPLWIVLGVPRSEVDGLKVQLTSERYAGNAVLDLDGIDSFLRPSGNNM